jgi:hypothetical protein
VAKRSDAVRSTSACAVVGDDVSEADCQGKPTVCEATAEDARRMERERAEQAKAKKAERDRLAGKVEQAAKDREDAADQHSEEGRSEEVTDL